MVDSNNFWIVFLSVVAVIEGFFLAIYTLYLTKIKIDNDTLRTENDTLKVELGKQKITFEKSKFEQEQQNRKEDKKEEKSLKRIEHDKELFEKLIEILPTSSHSIILVRDESLNMFPSEKLNDFNRVINDLNGSEYSFLDTNLEDERKKLYNLINKFINDIAIKTYPHHNNASYICVPPEWESRNPELYKDTLDTLHTEATELFTVYDEFIKFAKKRLY